MKSHSVHLSYVICTAQRSGSWMLCSLLSQTRIAGYPVEYFGFTLNEELGTNQAVSHARTTQEFFDAARQASSTPNGVFGTKLHANQTPIFLRRASADAGRYLGSLKEAFETEFPNVKYIFLTRTNKVAQAVSLYRATASQIWHLSNADAKDIDAPIYYDRFGIERCYEDCVASDRYWEGFFGTHRLSHIRVTYEELIADYAATTRRILAYLGLPWHMDIAPSKTIKQSNAQSLEFERQFISEGEFPEEKGLSPEKIWAPY